MRILHDCELPELPTPTQVNARPTILDEWICADCGNLWHVEGYQATTDSATGAERTTGGRWVEGAKYGW